VRDEDRDVLRAGVADERMVAASLPSATASAQAVRTTGVVLIGQLEGSRGSDMAIES
jgi:hypothetical protein